MAQAAPVQEEGSTVTLPPREDPAAAAPLPGIPVEPTTPPGELSTTPVTPPPAPPAGEPGSGVGPGVPPPAIPPPPAPAP